jgi:hypothetical protein
MVREIMQRVSITALPWWCHGAPPQVTSYRWTSWFVRVPSWLSWLYSLSDTESRLTTASITRSDPGKRVAVKL